MRFKWDTIWLTDEGTHAKGVTLNGRQRVQDAEFLRAAQSSLFARGNRSLQISFEAEPKFSTVRSSEEFFLNHYNTLADSGTLTVRIGLESESPYEVLLQNAVLADIAMPRLGGVSADVRYTFRAPRVSGITYSPPADEDMRSGSITIPQDAESYTVTGLALPSVPLRIICSISRPAGGNFIITPTVDYSTLTTDGFDVYFSNAPETTDYKLDYIAVL